MLALQAHFICALAHIARLNEQQELKWM